MTEKLKSWLLNDQIFYGIMVILVAISSFVLGRLSVDNGNTTKPTIQMIEPITLTATAPLAKSIEAPQEISIDTNIINQFVASKNGKRYYLKSCSGAKRIKPENLVSFDSRESAEAAGYTKAANCSGL